MPKRILVVDDDEAILEFLQLLLEEEGYEVLTSPTGENLPDLSNSQCVDMVLLDYQLPDKNGDEVVRELKCKEDTANIPVVLISANPAIKQIAKDAEADDFLAKPFDIDDLLNLIKRYVY